MKTYFLCYAALLTCSPLWAAHWESIGPFGGSAAVIQVDPHHPGTVLAATSNSLLFRSIDGGDAWSGIPFPAQLRATLHAFLVDPQNPGVYFAGLANDAQGYAGLYRTGDDGRTWKRLSGLGQRNIWSLSIWPKDSQVIAAGAEDGVFLSRDGGEQWARISPESQPVVSLAFDPKDSEILYAGTPHLPWKTTDGGSTWQTIHTGMLDDSDVFSIHVDWSHPARVYASACSGIYCSVDQGANWTKLTGARGASFRTYQITQHPLYPNMVFAGTTGGLVKSVDSGKTWKRLSADPTRWIAFDPARPSRIFVATDEAGIFRSDDLGESLQTINRGFCNRHLLSLAASGTDLYTSTVHSASGGIFRRTDSRDDWERITPSSQFLGQQMLKIVAIDSTRLYALTSKRLYTSSDGGRTWAVVSAPPTSSGLTALLVTSSESPRLLVGTDDGIYYNDDSGQDWLPARSPSLWSHIRSLVTLGPKSIAAVTPSAILFSTDGIDYRPATRPGGTAALNGMVGTYRNGVLAATSQGLMKSRDSGMTWQPVPGALKGSTVSIVCKHPTRPGVIFASSYGIVFISVDDGASWISLTSDEDGVADIRELVVVPGTPDRLFALTRSQGVYSVPLGSELRVAGDRMRTAPQPVEGLRPPATKAGHSK